MLFVQRAAVKAFGAGITSDRPIRNDDERSNDNLAVIGCLLDGGHSTAHVGHGCFTCTSCECLKRKCSC